MTKANTLEKIGFGCVGLTAQASQSKALRLLDCAYDHGITFFDTAPIYGKGYSEILLGKFMANKRNKVTVTTKFGLGAVPIPNLAAQYALILNHLKRSLKKVNAVNREKSFDYQQVPYRLITKAAVERDFNFSLKRLNTTYIDNYLLHEAVPSYLSEDALEFLLLEKEKGTIRKLGLGVNNRNLLAIDENQLSDWEILQYEYGKNVDNKGLAQKFPNKIHIYHSILKSLPFLKTADIDQEVLTGYVFAQILSTSPNARILFSSSSETNIVNNIKSTELHSLQL